MPGNSYCGVYGCTNNTKSTPHLRFFSVPKDEERRRQWASLIDREDIIASQVRACVCSSHFQSSMLTNKRLKCNAVPSINLPVTSVQPPANIECTQSMEVEIGPVPVMTKNLEVKMTDSNPQSAPVFIDVSAGSEQYPINVLVNDTPTIPTTATTTTENLVENVKTEPDCKLERASSPFGSFLDIQPRRIRCTECNKYSAENEEKMLRHVRKVHRGENPFQCYMCDYSTYNKSLFEEHVRIHQGIKPFKCSHCSYRSASKKNTKKHELIHRPDNPHKCSQCGFIARHLRSLNCHINTEHSQGPWVVGGQVVTEKPLTTCNYCKKKIEDMETHEKSRKKCRVCQMVLCNKGLVKKHMQASHGEKTKLCKADFVCAICKWSSNVKPRILLHLIHHPNQPIDDAIVDVRVLKQCGIVGQGW